jgi:hypothetical protein
VIEQQVYFNRSAARKTSLWPRYVGIILPAIVNYGFLLANRDHPHWGALLASALVLVVCIAFLALRGDWKGGIWVVALYFPLNAWPIVLNVTGPLGD